MEQKAYDEENAAFHRLSRRRLEENDGAVDNSEEQRTDIDTCPKATAPCIGAVTVYSDPCKNGCREDVRNNKAYNNLVLVGKVEEIEKRKQGKQHAAKGKDNAEADARSAAPVALGHSAQEHSLNKRRDNAYAKRPDEQSKKEEHARAKP